MSSVHNFAVMIIKLGLELFFFFFRSCLDRLVADNFPLRSSEFPKGSPKFQDYITAIDRVGIFHVKL